MNEKERWITMRETREIMRTSNSQIEKYIKEGILEMQQPRFHGKRMILESSIPSYLRRIQVTKTP